MNKQVKDLTIPKGQDLSLNLTDTLNLGEVLAQSGMFSDVKTKAQAVAKILAGRELGLGPIVSMTKIYMVKDKITLGAEVMGSLIKKSGTYDYTVKKLTNNECELEFYKIEGSKRVICGTSSFCLLDAQKAGVAHGDNWKKYPRNMLMARAVSNGARWYCPHLISGAYIPEELGLPVNGETGEMKVAEIPLEEKLASGAPQIEKVEEVIPEEEPELDLTEKISDKQRVRLYTICTKANWTHDQAKAFLKIKKFDSATDVTLKSYDSICEYIEKHPHKAKKEKEDNKIDSLTKEIEAEAERVSDKVYQELLEDLGFTEKDLDDKEKAETVLRLLKKI